MKGATVWVRCDACGKRLRGVKRVTGHHSVNRHNRPLTRGVAKERCSGTTGTP